MDAGEWTQRKALVAYARTWIGTPYHEQADVLGAGVDCGMSLVRWFVDTGLVAPFDPRPYPSDWMMHRDEERYLGILKRLAKRTFDARRELPKAGDVVVWRYGRTFSHGGLVTGDPAASEPDGWPWVVHAYAEARMVVEEDVRGTPLMTEKFGIPRPTLAFSYWA